MTSAATPNLLPNIRKLFKPDLGHVIIDVDLAGADAQVVAWEADDEDLKDAFRRGLKIHHKNAADMWGEEYTSLPDDHFLKKRRYREIKASVHATNYLGSAKTVATTLGWKVAEAKAFQKKWFELHPGILEWQNRTRQELENGGIIKNIFGYRIVYLDRPGAGLTDAIAWKPQSTVANVCSRGGVAVRENLSWVRPLLQVHDSLIFSFTKKRLADLPLIRRYLRVECPYPDPLVIPWGIKISDKSWGDCQEMTWEEATNWRP